MAATRHTSLTSSPVTHVGSTRVPRRRLLRHALMGGAALLAPALAARVAPAAAQIVASEQIARLAQEFDAAQRPATQRIEGWRPRSLRAVDRTSNIGLQGRAAGPWQAGHADPAKAYAGRSVTPLAGPGFPTFDTQIRPVASLRAEA